MKLQFIAKTRDYIIVSIPYDETSILTLQYALPPSHSSTRDFLTQKEVYNVIPKCTFMDMFLAETMPNDD